MDELEAERRIRETFVDLDVWDATAGPIVSSKGSDLAGDDLDWPPFAVSQVAWCGLQVAVDHLQAVRHHLDRAKSKRPRHFLFAGLTLCRTALVGASQAVWVLAPGDRALRIERARTVVAYTQKQHLKYLTSLQTYSPEPHQGTDTVAAHVESRIKELDEKRVSDEQAGGLNTTRMIREAAEYRFGDLAEEAVLAWQEGSGAAHGLIWQVLGQQSTIQTGRADEKGLAPFEASGSFDRIANPYMAAYLLSHRGWELLRSRAS